MRVAGEELVLLPERALFWPAREHPGRRRLPLGQGRDLPRGRHPDPHRRHRRRPGPARQRPAAGPAPAGWWCWATCSTPGRAGSPPAPWPSSALAGGARRGSRSCWSGATTTVTPAIRPTISASTASTRRPSCRRSSSGTSRPAETDGYTLAGHVHPGIVLAGPGLQRERLPCFWLGRERPCFPAFGSFTGLGPVHTGARRPDLRRR